MTARQAGARTPASSPKIEDSRTLPSTSQPDHIFRIHASEMTDATSGAPPPKKRSLFKRAAWQDAAKQENEDIFSHSNEFGNIVAEENRRKEEAKKKKQAEAKRTAEEEQKREQAERQDKKGKRRKVSTDYDEPILLHDDSADSGRISRSQSKGWVFQCAHVMHGANRHLDAAGHLSPQPHRCHRQTPSQRDMTHLQGQRARKARLHSL